MMGLSPLPRVPLPARPAPGNGPPAEPACIPRRRVATWGGGRGLRLVEQWRRALTRARAGELGVLRHPWHRSVPDGTVQAHLVKVLCSDAERLARWGARHGLPAAGICHRGGIPHYDLWGALAEEAWLELAPSTLGGNPPPVEIARRHGATHPGDEGPDPGKEATPEPP